jgi:SNF2 family DNA or RNA helicase
VLAYLMRFKQICNHPSQFLGDGGYEPADSGKFDRLGDLRGNRLAAGKGAGVHPVPRDDRSHRRFSRGRVRPGRLVLHGGTAVKSAGPDRHVPARGRAAVFRAFLKAGGTGLNLTAASHVIHFDRWWNPAVENQATDRAFRIGQHRNVVVHKFICRGRSKRRSTP